MVVTLIIVLPGTNTPQITTTPWHDNTSLLVTLQNASLEAPPSAPISFAVQYGGAVPNGTSGYNLVMMNGTWTTNNLAPLSYWSIQVNGTPLSTGVAEYIVQAGDVIVFTYNEPSTPAQ